MHPLIKGLGAKGQRGDILLYTELHVGPFRTYRTSLFYILQLISLDLKK